ncbi:MAG: cofactor-independent phosphoglycerate mutase [Lachnospiraceae bacterium]|nr:cofactor-independent phosphoglycerate mutase [Lachnospiraceae bacterium]MCI7189654.1 cofactor-independent phosphoglycerate mutase [Lachnospiraceae bacterium]MDD7629250.1 cofactor-independent phosphoglycerate mutase [Lachnospiraceae bacterium]MDY4118043.1 cofactor-independent phosphoglycerate mutase [Lachnospiraceae bacterium]
MSDKKFIVVLGDGMADEPIESLGGKTPLQYADTPALDRLSKFSEIGLVHTIPEGMKPGSDTANLSVLGYDPKIYYSGRSPLEALSIGVPMKDTDIALRCNIVTISENDVPFEEQIIIDHSSGEISTEDCAVLLNAVKEELQNETYQFYVGTSYRHCLIWNRGQVLELSQPHDVLGQVIGQYLPSDENLLYMMKRSYEILKDHPLNIERKKKGLNPANCCWFWGAGTKPMLSSFEEKNGVKGMMVSAVDLLKGIAVGAGMGVAHVEGANGGLNTNYEGKTQAALDALKNGYDFAYIHVEAPDEMGHQGSVEKKVKSIEYLDQRVIGPLTKALDEDKTDYRLLVMPDHPTPIRVRTHTADSVPYLLYDSNIQQEHTWNYNEKEAKESGNFVAEGHTIIDKLLQKA